MWVDITSYPCLLTSRLNQAFLASLVSLPDKLINWLIRTNSLPVAHIHTKHKVQHRLAHSYTKTIKNSYNITHIVKFPLSIIHGLQIMTQGWSPSRRSIHGWDSIRDYIRSFRIATGINSSDEWYIYTIFLNSWIILRWKVQWMSVETVPKDWFWILKHPICSFILLNCNQDRS